MIYLIIAVYILFVTGSWFATRQYLKKSRDKAELSDLIIVLLPVINVLVFMHYFEYLDIDIPRRFFFLKEEKKR